VPRVEAPTPLSSNERALAISVLIVGGLVVLFSITTVASSAYTLATGKVFGSDVSKTFTKLGPRDERMDELMDRQLEAQAAVQRKWAPSLLGAEGAYLVAVIGAIVCAIFALTRGTSRKALGQLALAASAVRIAVGVVTFLMTNELMRGMTGSIMAAMPSKSAEQAENAQRMMGGAMAGISAFSAGCMTLVMCGYFAVVGYVFLAQKKVP
jgi:hypothetical protein